MCEAQVRHVQFEACEDSTQRCVELDWCRRYVFLLSLSPAENHTMASHSAVSIRILDVNDNPPELATPYEASICEDAKPGQVRFSCLMFVIYAYKAQIKWT